MAYIVGHKCKLCEGALERCRQGHRISIEAIGKYKGYMLCNYCGAHFVNNEWKLSKDGRNLLFCLKARNALAHRIPNDQTSFDRYIEIILAISSSFGFVCDQI